MLNGDIKAAKHGDLGGACQIYHLVISLDFHGILIGFFWDQYPMIIIENYHELSHDNPMKFVGLIGIP